MRRAVQAVKEREMCFLKAAKSSDVPRSILLDYCCFPELVDNVPLVMIWRLNPSSIAK
jgi:hypothetical protein